MADTPSAGFGDLVALFGTNPFSGITKSFQQFQRGTEQLMTTMDNLNATLEQLNEVSIRITRMLDLFEEPARLLIPQVTRTIKAADSLVERLNAPIESVAPGLARLAEALQTPALNTLPKDLNDFLGTLRDLGRRLQPLGQMAESAGSMFSRSPFAAFLPTTGRSDAPATPPTATAPEPTPPPAPPAPALVNAVERAAKRPAKKAAATRKRATAKKPATKKPATRKPASPR